MGKSERAEPMNALLAVQPEQERIGLARRFPQIEHPGMQYVHAVSFTTTFAG